MSLGNFIMGALVTKLISDTVKKNKEKSQNSPEMFSEKKNDGSIRNNDGSYVLKPDSSGKIPGKGKIFRLHSFPPRKAVPDSFTPYEGACLTDAEAYAAGFEFKGFDRYHGVDFWLSGGFLRRDTDGKIIYVNRGQCNGEGIPGCVITGWHGKDETVRVPETIGGRPVVKIENRAFRGKNIREIYLPDCLLEIGDGAFEKCPALTRARLSKGLMSIGYGAFWQCDRLENVYLGNVRYIGPCAFGYCSALREIRLPDMVEYIGDRAFADSGIEKMCWNIISYAGDHILWGTPFWKQHYYIVLGDRIQKCYFRTDGEILIEDFRITCVGDRAFVGAQAEKVTFSDRVREIGSSAFRTGGAGQDIKEIYAPGAFRFGYECFSRGQKITVSKEAEFNSNRIAAAGYLHLEEDSFIYTDMEKRYIGGSSEKPCVCVMVRNILARVESGKRIAGSDFPRGILTLSEDGSTLTMDDRVEYTAARHIPNLGAKKLIVSRNMDTLRSFASIEDFEEIVIQKPVVFAREKAHFHPKKSVVIRFKFNLPAYGKPIDSSVLLYLPSVADNSPQAGRLYALYNRCLGKEFDFARYDGEILGLVSSYHARFTIARMRLEGDYQLKYEARDRYENFLLAHKSKAEFFAKEHGDTALLSLLEKLSEKTPTRKGELYNTAPQSSPAPVYADVVRPVPAKPDMDVPDNFTPYEGADMTCAEADAAGFEFVGADRYHGVDFWLSAHIAKQRDIKGETFYVGRGQYNGAGISGCAITGWHGSDETVKIPRSINGRPVVKIEEEAFKEKNIREIYLPDSVIEVGSNAFEKCTAQYARLSKGLARIGKRAFYECEALEKVYLGGVRDIGKEAFEGCKSLTAIRLPEIVEMLGGSVLCRTGLEKLYWNKIIHAGDMIVRCTPYEEAHDTILFGDCLQRCSIKTDGEIVIDDPAVTVIGSGCFSHASAKRLTLSENVREMKDRVFSIFLPGDGKCEVDEVYGPGLRKFGSLCFSDGQKVTVSGDVEYVRSKMASKGYLYIEDDSFRGTNMEKPYAGGSSENPCVCTMVRSILADVIPYSYYYAYKRCYPQYGFAFDKAVPREILTLSEDGSTLIMDDCVESTAARLIWNLGAKRLILSRNLHTLYSFGSIEGFEEIVIQKPVVYVRERLYFRPWKSVTLRFKFYSDCDKKTTDSAVLLYIPPIMSRTEEASRLYELYDKCLAVSFDFALYDREILNLVSSYRTRFTIARLRLEGGFQLNSEARERYENFLLLHKRKAEFTAKKHGDTALLLLLEKLSEKNTDPKGDPHKTAAESSPSPVPAEVVRPVPAKPDMDVPNYFTVYEGADMTCAEASAAGFEFVSEDRYHGVDFLLSSQISEQRDIMGEICYVHKGQYNGVGISGCAITGWHGSGEIVKIPRSINGRPVVKIEKNAFERSFSNDSWRYKISEIYMPDSVIEIDDYAFHRCSVEYARLSKNLVRIGNHAFYECSSLKKIYIGGARIIEECAFCCCRRLESVRLPEYVEKLGRYAFHYTDIKKLYWNKIIHADGDVLLETPYMQKHKVILLGDCLQKCSISGCDEIIVDSPEIRRIGGYCFSLAGTKKITLSDKIRVIEERAFGGYRETEIYAPGAYKFGESCICFRRSKITVSDKAEFFTKNMAATGYLYIEPYSFEGTKMETRYFGGSSEKPCVCVMVRNILARVEIRQDAASNDLPREILTLSEDGSTLIMDDRVEYTAARCIPNLGAKKLIVSSNMRLLYSFGSIEDFEEIVFRNPVPGAREKKPFRPKKSVTIRIGYDARYCEKPVDCAILLYLPKVTIRSAEAGRLYDLYDRCLGTSFDFDLYDREILNLVSSYHVRFTIARLRLEGDYRLKPEARERYENFLLLHKRKAEFTAKKHGDTALLSLLEGLSEKAPKKY